MAHRLLKVFPELILLGRQPKDGFQTAEPGVHERLVWKVSCPQWTV
jgi:hypothetical protein